MKVAILMLSYERFDILEKVLRNNMQNAGVPVSLFVLDQGSKDERVVPFLRQYADRVFCLERNIGIAAGLNRLISYAYSLGYTHFQMMANDIMEPTGWVVKKIEYFNSIQYSGMVSVSCGTNQYPASQMSGRWLYQGDVIGQFMISRETYEQVGAFREDFGKYGPVDNDYNTRCRKAGFVNYYLAGLTAEHLDDHNNELYGYDKKAAVQKTWPEFLSSLNDTEYHIAPGEHTLNVPEYVQ